MKTVWLQEKFCLFASKVFVKNILNPLKWTFVFILLFLTSFSLSISNAHVHSPHSSSSLNSAHSTSSPHSSPRSMMGDLLGISPFENWRTLSSKRFQITYPEHLEETAHKVASLYEEAHQLLAPRMYWEPKHIVSVVILDNTDSANGLASAAARFGMVLMLTPPEPWFSTASYDNWLRLLIIHEYTHYLNMDVTNDFMDVLRIFFGDVIVPNSLWPRWMLEGYAVYNETLFTQAGRGRSSFYEMVLRTSVWEGQLNSSSYLTLDRVNGYTPYAPGGETAYLFGYYLMKQVALNASRIKVTADEENIIPKTKNGEHGLGIMSYRSGGRIPYFINDNLNNIIGKDWPEIWDEWVQETNTRTQKDILELQKTPITPYQLLSTEGYAYYGLDISSDGKKMVYSAEDIHRGSAIYLVERSTPQEEFILKNSKRIMNRLGSTRIKFLKDGKHFLTTQILQHSQYKEFSDLVLVNADLKEWVAITNGLRIRDFDISEDETEILFTATKNEKVSLFRANFVFSNSIVTLKNITLIYEPSIYGRISFPRYLKSNEVVFTLHENNSPNEDILKLNLLSLSPVERLVQNNSFNQYIIPDHQGGFYFVSNINGVDNLWHYQNEQKIQQVTNFISGLSFPYFNKNEESFYGSIYTTQGWQIARFQPTPLQKSSEIKSHYLQYSPIYEANPKPVPNVIYPTQNYSPIYSLAPRQWAPYLAITKGGLLAGGEVLGFDTLDMHRYLATLAYQTETSLPDGAIIYQNRNFGPTFSLGYTHNSNRFSYDKNFNLLAYNRTQKLSIAGSFDYKFNEAVLGLSIGTQFKHEKAYLTAFKSNAISVKNDIPNIDTGLLYSNARSSRLSIAPEEGRRTALLTRSIIDPKSLGFKFVASNTEHFQIGHHFVLMPNLSYSQTLTPNGNSDEHFITSGTESQSLLNIGGGNTSLDKINFRGYPGLEFLTTKAATTSLDLRFPIWRIFRGYQTYPFFINQLTGLAFVESALLPGKSQSWVYLPSAGLGLRLTTTLLQNVPLLFTFQFHRGLNESLGGKPEVIITLSSAGLNF